MSKSYVENAAWSRAKAVEVDNFTDRWHGRTPYAILIWTGDAGVGDTVFFRYVFNGIWESSYCKTLCLQLQLHMQARHLKL